MCRLAKWLVYIAAISAAFIMTIAVIDVISSKAFDWSIPSSIDFIGELNVLLVFLAIAYTAQERGHIRITILDRFMSPGLYFAVRISN